MAVSRRTFFLGSLALPALADKKPPALRPGVLLILADELPAFMLGSYGNKVIKTPHLDRLAQMGMLFTNHFACSPIAGAGRDTLLTGRTPMQLGAGGALSADDASLAKILSGAGYTPQQGDIPAALQFLDGQSPDKPFFFTLNCPSLRPPYDKVPSQYLDLYSGQPFDGYAPQLPATNAKSGKEMLSNILPNVRRVAATLTQLDEQLGAVLAKLRAKGLTNSTLVVFTSASGAHWGRHGLWGAGDASEPPSMFDQAVKTPMLWSWPGHIPAIARRPELVSAYDFIPTMCELLSLEVPKRNLCGRSYSLLITGKPLPKKQPWRDTLCAHLGNTDMARENRYKVVLRNDGKGPNEVYDLVLDPEEMTNQADNPQFTTVKTELSTALEQWKQKYSA